MSDLVPFDIQTEIIKKLPIKSLIRLRSVSKPWKSLIDSPKSIHDNCLRDNQPHHLLVRYVLRSVVKYVSFLDDDDDSIPQQKFCPTVPVILKRLHHASKVGSSHGIVCFYGFYKDIDYGTDMVVLWNPTIRKSVGIVITKVLHRRIVIGFGVCPNTSDPKLVKITHNRSFGTETINCVFWEVEVFTLSVGAWRSISIVTPFKPVELFWSQVFINGVIYWLGYDRIAVDSANTHHRIISFDLKSEKFGEVFLSNSLVSSTGDLSVSKLMDSLVVIESYMKAGEPVCAVWKINHDVLKSCTKLYTVKADSAIINLVLEFSKNGELVMEVLDFYGQCFVEIYEPCSGQVKYLEGFNDKSTSYTVNSYTETLALLHQSDSIIY
ncbi:F-box protein At2g21930-like [Rutidosis leptorrhynchoides]|uniref:F-box protein At2g21930-like n=1 Tax=Rutidosis leptorrhynchoides TaxID=125765 RepID=UPI003A992536